MSAAPSSEHTGFFRRLRQLLAHTLELACVRLDLLALETRQEASRLLAVLLCALAAGAFICFGLVFLAVLLTVLLWDTHRLLALGVFTGCFLGGGAALAWLAQRRWRALPAPFEGSRQELAKDRQRFAAHDD